MNMRGLDVSGDWSEMRDIHIPTIAPKYDRPKKRHLSVVQANSTQRIVPDSTKKAMRATHLFASCVQNHFIDGICEFIGGNDFVEKSYTNDILSNLLLVGGIPRDILLGAEVDRVDITFNLRELTKIHLDHLVKYHSKKEQQGKSCQCTYWQHYLNKFEITNNEDEYKSSPVMERFHDCTYIFNARYFVDIFESDYRVKGKLVIHDQPKYGCITVMINGDVEYDGYNLRGMTFKFTDTFDEDKVLSVQAQEQIQKADDDLVRSHGYIPMHEMDQNGQFFPNRQGQGRWKSRALNQQDIQTINIVDEFDDEHKPISIEIYDTRIKDKLLTHDFSINTALIPLLAITEFFDGGDGQPGPKTNNIAIYFWEYIVENGITECDAIEDITVNRVLRVPQYGKEDHIVEINGTENHFWSIIELMVRLPNFYIDEQLVRAHDAQYNHWVNDDYFGNERCRRRFISKFTYVVEYWCRDLSDIRRMMDAMERMHFNRRLIRLIHSMPILKRELMKALSGKSTLKSIVFQSYGYPFDNTEIRNLLDENKMLREQIDALKQSKIELVRNTSKAIDDFRNLFTQK